jgi:phosphorylase kinase alpha/beta subunit
MCLLFTVVILAEDRCIQEKLQYYDLKVQTMAQVAPIQLYAASVLSSLFAHLGRLFIKFAVYVS